MAAPLVLSMQITADAANAVAGVNAATGAVKGLDAASAQTAGSAAQLSAAIKGTAEAAESNVVPLKQAADAHRAHGAATELNRTQQLLFTAAAKHTFDSLAAGLPIFTILTEQGAELAEAFELGNGGIGGTLTALGAYINPLTIGFGLLAGSIALAVKAGADYAAQQRELATLSGGVGHNVGATPTALNGIAESAAGPAGISIASARALEAQLLKTGKVGIDSFSGIIKISKDFGATVGLDSEKAAQELAQIFAEPAKGAKTLYEQYNLIDGATVRQVDRLVEQNRLYQAQGVLVAAIPQHLVKAEEAMSGWAKALDEAGRIASNISNSLGKVVTKTPATAFVDPEGANPFLAIQQDEQAEADRKAAEQKDHDDALKAAQDRANGLNDRAFSFGVAVADKSPANAFLEQQRQLQQQQTALEDAQRASEARKAQGIVDPLQAEEDERIARALAAVKEARESLLDPAEKARQIDQLDLQIAEARDPVTRAELTAMRERVALGGQIIDLAQKQATIEEARTRSEQQSIGQGRRRQQSLITDATARRDVNDRVASGALPQADANAALQLEQDTRPLLAIAATKEGEAKADLTRQIDALTEAYKRNTEEQRRSQALSLIDTSSNRLETTKTEISLLGQSEEVRTRILELEKAEQQIRQLGLATTSAEADRLRQLADANAAATSQLQRQSDAWTSVEKAGESAVDTLSNSLLRAQTGLQLTRSLVDDLLSTLIKLEVSNPLKNALFGTNYGTANDLSGLQPAGLIGQLFGGGAKTGTAAPVIPVTSSPLPPLTALVGSGGAHTAISDAYVNRLFQVESGGDPNQKTGSNYGLAQFGYADMKRFGLTDPFDPSQARDATILEARQNAGPLANLLGRQASAGELYLAHQQGLAGSEALLNPDNANVPAWQAIRPYYKSDDIAQQAITGNGGSLDQTSSQFSQMWVQKFQSGMTGATAKLTDFSSANDNAVKAVQGFGTGLDNSTKALTGDLSNASVPTITTNTNPSGTLDTSGGFIGSLGGFFSSLFGSITKVASSLFSGAGNILGGIGGGISSIFSAIFGHADGGQISGPGTGRSDSILAALSNGEFVVNANATSKHLPLLHAINDNRLPAFADGGVVGVGDLSGTRFVPQLPFGNSASSSTGAGAASKPAPLNVVINNTHSGADVSAKQSVDPQGNPSIEVLVKRVKSEMATEYGLSRPVGRR